jgi:hypothetical protein
MDFYFLKEFRELSVKCPPDNYFPKNMTVFRWVFDTMIDGRNFTPRYYLVPQLELEKLESIEDETVKDSKKCDMFALSLFDSEYAAKERFNYFLEQGKSAYKRFGTHIAKCEITEQDGLNENPNQIGHFNHHPVKNHQYETRFSIITKL